MKYPNKYFKVKTCKNAIGNVQRLSRKGVHFKPMEVEAVSPH